MKVKTLLEALNKFGPDVDVLCFGEEEELFEIERVEKVEAEKTRSKDGKPGLKFQRSEISQPHVILTIISDF